MGYFFSVKIFTYTDTHIRKNINPRGKVENFCVNIHNLGLPADFPGGSDGKESACNSGELDSIPGLGRSPGEGNDNPLKFSCLENSMDRRAWWATVHGVAKELDTTEQLNNNV